MKKEKKVMLGTGGFAAVLIIVGLLLGDVGTFANLLIISMFILIVPFFIHSYISFLWIKAIEDQFPNFIRDVADSVRSGMSFEEAIKISSKANYGKLTDEIVKMNNRLSWGTSFLRVLEIFGHETKKSKLISESINIISEAYKTGGNVDMTLDAVARDMLMFKELEADRVSLIRQHVIIMYGIFFMFLGIAIMIIFVMVPMIQQPAITKENIPGPFGLTFSNPCAGVNFFPCNYFKFIGSAFNLPEGITLYYTAVFFTAVIIQGIFTGLIAGQLSQNSIMAGSKHSIIMAAVTVSVFLTMSKLGLFPV